MIIPNERRKQSNIYDNLHILSFWEIYQYMYFYSLLLNFKFIQKILNLFLIHIMPAWLFEKRDLRTTPSAIDGIDSATENKYRREGARLIIDVGADLNL